MFKVILADGSTVWVDGTYLEELMEVLTECGDLHVEEQSPNAHAPGSAEVFDLSGTQNDFKGKQRLRHHALERYIVALRKQLAETTSGAPTYAH